MKAIAAEAGCSVMTVSLALRDHPKISESTRTRIRDVANRLGYRPNPMVATLMTHIRSSRPAQYQANLAFLTSHRIFSMRWVHNDIYRGVLKRAESLGFLVDIFYLDDYADHPGRLERILRSRNIQGVIISPLWESGSLEQLGWAEWSPAAVGYSLLAPRITRVSHHQFQGTELILETLRKKGYRRIGMAMDKIVDDKVNHAFTSAVAGFQLRHPEEERVPVLYWDGNWDPKELRHWLDTYKPQAVIGHDGLIDHLNKIGVDIPGDVAFAHINLPAQIGKWRPSGLNQNWELVGEAVVDSVVAQIHRNERGIPEVPKTILVDGDWVEGDTTPDLSS
jgi:DNA-binding LacI/PurR family transcriptional regulator